MQERWNASVYNNIDKQPCEFLCSTCNMKIVSINIAKTVKNDFEVLIESFQNDHV